MSHWYIIPMINMSFLVRHSRLVILLLVVVLGFGVTAVLFSGGEDTMHRRQRTEIDGIPLTVLDEGFQYPIQLTSEQWKQIMPPMTYQVMRAKGTERAFANPLWDNKEPGIYYSAATGQPLFHSDDKYDSGTGWPSFTKPISPDAVHYLGDYSMFMARVEVVDSQSGSHLGHVFMDGPGPSGRRYCMNSASLIFVPEGGEPPIIQGLQEALENRP